MSRPSIINSVTRDNVKSWMEALFDLIWVAEDSGEFSENDIDEFKTVMAWLMEDYSIKPEDLD